MTDADQSRSTDSDGPTDPPVEKPSTRRNIAFTRAGEDAAHRVQEKFRLPDLLDAARLSVAYAVRESLPAQRRQDFGPTNGSNYNVGSVDPAGELRDLIMAVYPNLAEDAYRIVETFMTDGAIVLDGRISRGEILSLSDLLEEARPRQ
jgi:hypothetical protein